ncbi:MAG: sodium-dependent transporter [Peptococcaceae bacterium]|jgi:NSS family neurotransmitter:Na+ symporter|nr:sodium-dependent transporter [Peptococcaceae bacterium]
MGNRKKQPSSNRKKLSSDNREKLSSRIGFILLSAGCAIGLGNVWRFPFITGRYGGALFVLIYLVCLVLLGVPVMTMEFAVGRASRKSVARSFHEIEPAGSKWHIFSWFGMAGNYLLMMFYTTVAGWILAYVTYTARGAFAGLSVEAIGDIFGGLVSSPTGCVAWMIVVTLIGFGVCAIGLQKGVEQVTKTMMSALFVILLILVVRAVTLPGAAEGLKFYLIPSLDGIRQYGAAEVIFAAMGQSFFTLSLGIGSMAIFGSYIGKERKIMGEAINVTLLDTLAALLAGLVIFPSCLAFGIAPDAGPPLIFITLPNIFNMMPFSQLWAFLFFLFMFFAALSTVVAVFENIVSFAVDITGMPRRKACLINCAALIVLALPCALGFNAWSGIQPMGEGTVILDLLDFIVSNNLLPLGALVYVAFCSFKIGWGWDKFLAEANEGSGATFPMWLKYYCMIAMPIIILSVFIFGYMSLFGG